MNSDIRLSVEFWRHPKTKKLIRRTGLEGARSLQILWLWAVVNRPDGDLKGMDDEAIELAADWNGEEGKLASTLVDVAFLDGKAEGRKLHGWLEYNAWQTGDSDRADTGRFNVLKSKMPAIHAKLVSAGITRLTKADYEELKVSSRTLIVVERLLKQASGGSEDTFEEPQSTSEATLEAETQGATSILQVDLSNPLQSPCPSPSPSPSLHFQEHTHDGSHDLSAPADSQGACASLPPLNGEDIEERKDAAQAQHRRGDYEFSLVREAYNAARQEGELSGRQEFLALYNSSAYPGHDEIIAGINLLCAEDDQFQRGFAPSLAKFLTQRMWTMKPRAPVGQEREPELTPERLAARERIKRMEEELKQKQAARAKAKGW